MTTIETQNLLDTMSFSEPKSVVSNNGLRHVRSGTPTDAFWQLWKNRKDDLKSIGISVSKFRGEWEVSWWSNPAECRTEKIAKEATGDELSNTTVLKPYQLTSVALGTRSMRLYGRCLLGHSTGLGKTFIALGIVRERRRKALVVCPKTIRTDWTRAAEVMGVELLGVHGWEWIKTGKTDYGHFENNEWVWSIPDEADLILDEVHRAKGLNTKNSRLLEAVSVQGIPALGLSATLASNPLHLNAAGRWLRLHKGGRSFWAWALTHGVERTRFGFQFTGGNKHLRSIHEQIFPELGNRLRIQDVADIPDNVIEAKAFDMDSVREIANEYELLQERIHEIRAKEALAIAQAQVLAEITAARQRIELLKSPSLVSMTKDLIEEGNSVFIAVNFRETLAFLANELKTKCVIHGGLPEMDRRKSIDAFQQDQSRIIIGVIGACREGLNLQDVTGRHPRHSLILPCQSVFDLRQVLGRVGGRVGGKSKAFQRIVYAAGTIEEGICFSLQGKLDNLDSLMDGQTDAASVFMKF